MTLSFFLQNTDYVIKCNETFDLVFCACRVLSHYLTLIHKVVHFRMNSLQSIEVFIALLCLKFALGSPTSFSYCPSFNLIVETLNYILHEPWRHKLLNTEYFTGWLSSFVILHLRKFILYLILNIFYILVYRILQSAQRVATCCSSF